MQTVIQDKVKYYEELNAFKTEEINRFSVIEERNLEIFWGTLSDRIDEFVQYISDNLSNQNKGP